MNINPIGIEAWHCRTDESDSNKKYDSMLHKLAWSNVVSGNMIAFKFFKVLETTSYKMIKFRALDLSYSSIIFI